MKSLFRAGFLRSVSAGVLAVSLAACSSNPQPLNRPGDLPDSFTAPVDKTAPIWPQANWWASFGAEELPGLQETAQKENLDIAVAGAQVLQAEANDGVALSALFPTVSAQPSFTRTGGGSSRTNVVGAAGTIGTTTVTRGTFNSYNIGLSASYQQGFFGTQFLQLQTQREDLRASRYAAAVIGLSTASSVADQYFTVLSLRERIAIARENVAAARRILTVVQAKVQAGVSSNLDLAEQQAIVAQNEARVPGLIQMEKQARYNLAILLGRAPERYDIKTQNLDGIASPAVQPGLPSESLLRNPSVAQAEAQLYAAHANLNAARTLYFPSISLTSTGSYTSSVLAGIINPANLAFSIGASVLQTIFDGGRIHAENDLAAAQQTQLVANYRKVVFTAFSDVETALDLVKSTADQQVLIDQETRADAEAFRISELQYREGTIDILTLLQNQQNLFTAQDSLVQIKLARLEASISLYNALGGGWEQKADDANYKNQLDWWPL